MDKWERKWRQYHEANPVVFAYLENLCRELRKAGVTRTGMTLLFGRLRWDMAIQTQRTDQFKLNENYACFYARELMRVHPEWGGMFELRTRRSEAA